MKRSILFVLFMSAIWLSISAYDYQTVYSHRIALFENLNGGIKCLRIDSTKFNGDSILSPLKNIQELSPNCYTPYGASWLGDKIIVNPHWNYFFNQNNDTIRIKTDAKKYESWIFYNRSDLLIEAMVQFHDTMTVFGVRDSVKTVDLTAYGTSGNSSFATGYIILSKHFGLIKTYNFIVFPDYTNNSPINTALELNTLAGLTNPTVGLQNLTWFDAHDYQVGDEFHYTENWNYLMSGGNAGFSKIIVKILSRENYKDSIRYVQDVEMSEDFKQSPSVETVTTYRHVQTKNIITRNDIFDLYPGIPVFSNDSNYIEVYSMQGSSKSTIPTTYSKSSGNCWTTPIDDACNYSTYQKGLGLTYSGGGCFMLWGNSEYQLVYYKKGSKTVGTPLVITGISQPETQPTITVYPNPAHDKISIVTEMLTEPCIFELMDVRGNILLHSEVSDKSNSVSLTGFANGLYLYRLLLNGKMIKAGKIVKM